MKLQVAARIATCNDAMMQIQLTCMDKVYPSTYPAAALSKWKNLLDCDHFIAKTQTTGWYFVAVINEERKNE